MLGPDHSDDSSFAGQFINTAEKALRKGGLTLVFSDRGTVSLINQNFPGSDLSTSNIWARIAGKGS